MWKTSKIPFVHAKRPMVMAHRGDSANIPENTLESFQDAYKLNVDVIETDVRLTKDGQFVFFHDPKVNRTTNKKGKISDFTLEELKQLDAGYNYKDSNGNYPFRGKGLRICSLKEIIPLFPNVKFNMDIKDKDPKAPQILAEVLKELKVEERVQVGSFHQKQIDAFRKLSKCPTSAGPKETLEFRKISMKWVKDHKEKLNQDISLSQEDIFNHALDYVSLTIPEKLGPLKVITEDMIKFAHKIGIAVFVWTVNDPIQMRKLINWGVDGIFTDVPKDMIMILQKEFGF